MVPVPSGISTQFFLKDERALFPLKPSVKANSAGVFNARAEAQETTIFFEGLPLGELKKPAAEPLRARGSGRDEIVDVEMLQLRFPGNFLRRQ